MGILSKLFGFKRNMYKNNMSSSSKFKSQIVNGKDGYVPEISYEIIDVAPNAYLVNKGARVCVGQDVIHEGTMINTYCKRLEYCQRIAKMGHESVLEHSNIISLLRVNTQQSGLNGVDITSLMTVIGNCKYLNMVVREQGNFINILLSGSIRGFIHALRETDIMNPFMFAIRNVVYHSIEKEFLFGIKDRFPKNEYNTNCIYQYSTGVAYTKSSNNDDDDVVGYGSNVYQCTTLIEDPKRITNSLVNVIYATDTNKVWDKIRKYGFTREDLRSCCIVSFEIHDISRACANQITRHRIAISQESQRYVSHKYTKQDGFVDPIQMVKDNKDKLKSKYDRYDFDVIKIVEDALDPFKIYHTLLSDGVDKEDARAFLPMNVKTKLVVTMDLNHWLHFLSLRSDNGPKKSGAQFEIKEVADQMIELVQQYKYKYIGDHEGRFIPVLEPLMTKDTMENTLKNKDISPSNESLLNTFVLASLVSNMILQNDINPEIHDTVDEVVPNSVTTETVDPEVANIPPDNINQHPDFTPSSIDSIIDSSTSNYGGYDGGGYVSHNHTDNNSTSSYSDSSNMDNSGL